VTFRGAGRGDKVKDSCWVCSRPIDETAPAVSYLWLCEEKVDGWRILAYKDGAAFRLISRTAVDHTRRFPELAAAIAKLRPETLVRTARSRSSTSSSSVGTRSSDSLRPRLTHVARIPGDGPGVLRTRRPLGERPHGDSPTLTQGSRLIQIPAAGARSALRQKTSGEANGGRYSASSVTAVAGGEERFSLW
jgi:ATP dependent DNA ligase-like protein